MKTDGKTCWKELREFTKQTQKNGIVHLTFAKEKGPEKQEPLRARCVERHTKPGPAKKGQKKERMVLLTSLEEEDGCDRPTLLKMYQARWGVETLFRERKSFLDVEPFHGKTVQSCEQDIAASLIWMALATHLQAEAESRMENRRVLRSDCLRYAADRLMDYSQVGRHPGALRLTFKRLSHSLRMLNLLRHAHFQGNVKWPMADHFRGDALSEQHWY